MYARPRRIARPLMLLSALIFLASTPIPLQAGEAFYLLMFGSQRIPNNPKYAHTYATFVRAYWEGDGDCPQNPTLESHTISWLPSNMTIRDRAVLPECGTNFDLHVTTRWCLDNQMRISLWGAYRIKPELYRRARNHSAELESGRIRYKANDFGYTSNHVSNCIHAVSCLVEGPKVRIGSPGWGEPASFFILLQMEPYLIDPGVNHGWLGSALGLDQYPILYREYRFPRSGAILGPLFRILGGEENLVPSYGPPAGY